MFSWQRILLAASLLTACAEPTKPPVTPTVPANVAVTLVDPSTAAVTWAPNPPSDDVKSYSIFRNAVKVGESIAASFVDTGLKPETVYAYSVAAISKDGLVSAPSAETAASTVTTLDVTKPTVISTVPANNSTGISTTSIVKVTFSEAMDPSSINTTSFSLKTTSGTVISGTVVYVASSMSAEFRPTFPLPEAVAIGATISTGVRDVAGNNMAFLFNWGFSTRDDTPPSVFAVSPANGEKGVSPLPSVQITFTENMDAATINATNITLKATSTSAAVPGTVIYNASTRTATFTPSVLLAPVGEYMVTVSAVKDSAGNSLASPFSSTFTTGDTTPPRVIGFEPGDGRGDVPLDTKVKVFFSEAMDPSTINTTTIRMLNNNDGSIVAATVTYDAATMSATLTPSSLLSTFTGYTILVYPQITDVAGNILTGQFSSAWATGR